MYENKMAAQANFQSALGGIASGMSDVACREPEVRSAMNGLQIEASELAGSINILLDRLAPILAAIPMANEANLKATQPSTLLAQEIRGMQGSVADSRYRIQDILRRLEI